MHRGPKAALLRPRVGSERPAMAVAQCGKCGVDGLSCRAVTIMTAAPCGFGITMVLGASDPAAAPGVGCRDPGSADARGAWWPATAGRVLACAYRRLPHTTGDGSRWVDREADPQLIEDMLPRLASAARGAEAQDA